MRASRIAGLLILSAASVAATVSSAVAEVIVYDNSDATFVWVTQTSFTPFGVETHLDITLPPTQSGLATNNSIKKFRYTPVTSSPDSSWFQSDGSAAIARSPHSMRVTLGPFTYYTFYSFPALAYAPTELIGPELTWSDNGAYAIATISLIGHAPTLGVRVTLADGVHYGWIRVERIANSNYKPVAWGYETEPNTPIAAWGEPDADGVLNVPAEYPTIRTALEHVQSGQQVVVADGIYTSLDNVLLDFHGKAITLRSANGPQQCVLKAAGESPAGPWTRVVEFRSGEGADSVLEGFTIADGYVFEWVGPDGNPPAGSGILCQNGSSPTIRNCVLENNVYDWSNGTGGGAMLIENSSPLIVNCLFSNNECAGWGGAINMFGGAPNIVNCTITKNVSDSAPTPMLMGAVAGSGGILTNCIIFDNIGAELPSSPPLSVAHSCIEGGYPGIGNISANPQFVNPSGDYHLGAGSPCIDAASNPAVPRGVTEDLDGNPRFQDDPATTDTGLGRAPVVDMGAYEFQPPLDPADLDEDGDVDGFDLALLLGQWTGTATYSPCPPHVAADLNGDCKINGFDLAILLASWG